MCKNEKAIYSVFACKFVLVEDIYFLTALPSSPTHTSMYTHIYIHVHIHNSSYKGRATRTKGTASGGVVGGAA